jgi:hypothetical protein
MTYKIVIDDRAIDDIEMAMNYYQTISRKTMLGFYRDLQKKLQDLSISPYHQIRYNMVRCLPLIKYPFMIHFMIDEPNKQVLIIAILNTYQNPDSSYPI